MNRPRGEKDRERKAREDRLASGALSDEQRLKDLQARRLDLMQKQSVYRSTHALEFFRPHPAQTRFLRAVLDPKRHTFAAFGGNRSGKTAIVCALAVCLTQGRLIWVPKPTPFLVPAPVSLSFTPEVIRVTHTLATWEAMTRAWQAIHVDVDASPLNVPLPGDWVATEAGITGTFPVPRIPRDKSGYDQLAATLAIPPDPGALRFRPPVRIRLLAEKTDTLAEVQNPYLRKFFAPEMLAATKKGQTGVIDHWLCSNGSQIDSLTYQQDPASMEGWSGMASIYDEPPPRAVFVANRRGLVDHKGISLFSMTPLKEPWISDEIANNPDPAYFSITMSSYDNPHVDPTALDDFFSTLTDEERETRRDGKFLHLQGLIFKEFDKQTHVVEPFVPDRQYTVYVSIDTHPRTEQAVVFAAVDRKERVYVFKELFRHGTPEEVAGWIAAFHRDVHPVRLALIDPSSQGDSNRGDSTFDLISRRLRDEGVPLDFGSKDLSGGIAIMHEYFRSRNGQASLFVTEDCTRTLWELQRYVWEDWKGGNAQSKTELNKPRDRDDHLIECTRRILQLPPRWCSPSQTGAEERGWRPLDAEAGY